MTPAALALSGYGVVLVSCLSILLVWRYWP